MTEQQGMTGHQAPTRAGFVALVGAPNAGKSSLLNRLVGAKVSIVSPKVQTTRRRIIGITMVEGSQVMFVDTPGIFAPSKTKRLERAMVSAAWTGAGDADLVLLVVDAKRGLDGQTRHVLEGLRDVNRPIMLVLNKIDLVKRTTLLPLIAALNEAHRFEGTWLVSARTGDGCGEILKEVADRLPEGPFLFPEDQLSDLSNRAMAAELTREKVFLQLEEELPYSITVETDQWLESPDGEEIRIDQTVYVMRDGQKAIVLGKGGRQIRAIGEAARLELEETLGARVHLFLHVKVRERWLEDRERYREMGLDYPD
ncbi:GTPase Era [Marinimicrococcus flavescens]|uniref:GTPase Era n=1 Tax=Marinimicrococcus flavescens TaxID=3031815 RepID=A0AAP3XQ23_9PROT|nr:GTPase Era [Marinimicrococcus flavescens]